MFTIETVLFLPHSAHASQPITLLAFLSPRQVCLPAEMIVEYLSPYSPELQPAERLWKLVDELLINTYFETIDELETILVERCRFLQENMLL